jgi:hypothetical protein
MKLKNWIFALAGISLFTACNNASDGDMTKDSTVVNTNTSDNTNTYQQGSGNVTVTEAARSNFSTQYPNASNVNWRYYDPTVVPVDWEWAGWTLLDTSDYAANFSMDGSDYWVWYDESGNWVGTVSTVTDHSTLPSAVSGTLKSKYSGYNIVSVDKENDKNRTAYEIDLDKNGEKMTVLIDENGNVMKSKGADGKMKADIK